MKRNKIKYFRYNNNAAYERININPKTFSFPLRIYILRKPFANKKNQIEEKIHTHIYTHQLGMYI